MGSGNTKVKKIKKTSNKEEKGSERHQETVNGSGKSIDDSSPASGRSDNNNNGKQKPEIQPLKDGDDWVGPGMIADDTRHGVTAADLMIGKQRLKPTRRCTNNNCNKTVRSQGDKNNRKYPHPKPRLLHGASTSDRHQPHSSDRGTNTRVTNCTGMRLSTRVEVGAKETQCCQGISPEVDRLALEVFGESEGHQLCVENEKAISRLTVELRSNRQPLPAPRLSKSRSIKKIRDFSSDAGYFGTTKNNTTTKEEKKSVNLSKSRSHGQQLYDDYDVYLMAEIEREFGHCFG